MLSFRICFIMRAHRAARLRVTRHSLLSTMNAETQNPFADLKIDSREPLHKVTSRSKCPQCNASRKYFCYQCYVPMQGVGGTYRTIKLPLQVDIIKHHLERDGKSTAVHAKLLAPDHVTIYTYPDIPQYVDKSKILLVFPYKDAIPLEDLVSSKTIDETEGIQAHTDYSMDPLKSIPPGRDGKKSTLKPNDTGTKKSCSQINAAYTGSPECKSCRCRVDDEKLHSSASFGVSESRTRPSQEHSCDEIASHLCHHNTSDSGHPYKHTKPHHLCDNKNLSETCHYEHKLQRTDKDVDVELQEHLSKKIRCDHEPCLFDRVIFIDSTWNQCGVISRDKRLEGIQRVILRDRETTFWRSQPGKPRTYLATIEAIYYFFMDYHKIILRKTYSGQYDNLLFFYCFMYDLVKKTTEERDLVQAKT